MSSPLPLRLKSKNKYLTDETTVSERTKHSEETLAEILPLCPRIGITRISDITCLDKLYIPNFSAILPGTEDTIWVYSGKGTTKSDAKASAIMEAIERFSSLSRTYSKDYIRGTYSE